MSKEQVSSLPPEKIPFARNVRKFLLQNGLKPPAGLADDVIHKSGRDRGNVGKIVVRRYSGIVRSPAHRLTKKFVERVGGKEQVEEGLSAIEGDLTKEVKMVLDVLRQPSSKRKSLSFVIAETGATPSAVMDAYTRGMIHMNKMEAAVTAAKGAPQLVKDLLRHAFDKEGYCDICMGSGEVPRTSRENEPSKKCKKCDGTGQSWISSEHKEFAVEKLLEVNKLVGKDGPAVQVGVQVNNKISGGGPNFMEKMVRAADRVLYDTDKDTRGEVMEAEVVSGSSESAR